MSSPSPQFRFNPITGQLDLIDDHGSGGGGNITLNAGSGPSLVGTSFDIEGAKFGSGPTPVNDTYTSGGNFFIENRAWTSAYVVDFDTTPGQRGTFTDIQSAVNQAVADGYTRTGSGLIAVIEVRVDNQIGNINIPENALIHIKGQTPSGSPDNNVFGSYIGGTITLSENAFLILENLVLQTGGGDVLTLIDNNASCIIYQSLALDPITISGNASYFAAQECSFYGMNLNNSTASPGSPTIFVDCHFFVSMSMSENSYSRFIGCTLSDIILADNAIFEIYDCFNLPGGGRIFGSTTNNCFAKGYHGWSSDPLQFLFDFTGTILYTDISITGGRMFGPNTTPQMGIVSQGNFIQSRNVNSDYSVSEYDYCIEVDTSTNPITITLPVSIRKDQTFIIFDGSGNASVNNITVNVNGGTKFINGLTSQNINTNYGGFKVKVNSNFDYIIIP